MSWSADESICLLNDLVGISLIAFETHHEHIVLDIQSHSMIEINICLLNMFIWKHSMHNTIIQECNVPLDSTRS